jgi:hypothetical protein
MDFTAREISELLEIDYVTISPLLRPMARRGLIHEAGMKLNNSTGHKALMWKVGPAAGWTPGNSLPARATGPQERHRWFTADEILDMKSQGRTRS